MCGFAGICNAARKIDNAELVSAAAAVNFRGPDHTGIRVYDECFKPCDGGVHGFFHNRLAVLDLDERADQPFEDSEHLLLYNGEIYNYRELREELKACGFGFRTTSDTEVLFFALKAWGADAVRKLNGMFAFAFIGKKEGTILLARDRLGIKPFYIRIEGAALIFASEAASIARLSSEKPQVDLRAVEAYMVMQYVPSPYTMLKGVRKVLPGHYCLMSIKDLQERKEPVFLKYWDAFDRPREDVRSASIEELLKVSLELQLHADVPVGTFISSGVDSSLLTAMIHKHFAQDREFRFYTVAFNEKSACDESDAAAEYIRAFNNPNLVHEKLFLSHKEVGEKFHRLYRFLDEPFADKTVLLNWAISEKARGRVKVALSGDGADELFCGYDRYHYWERKIASRKEPMGRALHAVACRSAWLRSRRKGLALEGIRDPLEVYLQILNPRFPDPALLTERLATYWFLDNPAALKARPDLPSLVDIKSYLVDAMFYKVDRASMAASLEVRVPYTDNRIVDRALSMTHRQKKTARLGGKTPLKELLAQIAPHYPLARPKRGFSFPARDWVRFRWRSMVCDTITKGNLEALGLDAQGGLKRRDAFYKGDEGLFNEVWFTLNLLMWHRAYGEIRR